MAITPEMSTLVEQKILGVDKNLYRRSGLTINKFIEAYGIILAQTVKDLQSLTGAGFNADNIPLYNAYLEMLSLIVGEKRGTLPANQTERTDFNQKYALAQQDKKRLSIVANYIVQTISEKAINRNLKKADKGGIVGTLCSNLALISIVKKYPQLASQIRPGQFTVTPDYLNEVSNRAIELLGKKGFVIEQGVPKNVFVDRQNRLITLSMDAISDIRKFADAAFFANIEYYNENYAAPFRRTTNNSKKTKKDDATKEKTEGTAKSKVAVLA